MKSKPVRLPRRTLISVLPPATLGLLCAGGVSAQIVSFEFAGTLSNAPFDTGTYLPDDLAEGQPIFGTITYTGIHVSDFDAPDPKNGVYIFTGAAQGDFSMSATVTTPMNTYVFSSVAAPAINNIDIQLSLGAVRHEIYYTAGDPLMNGAPLPVTANGSLMGLALFDSTRTAVANDSLPTSAPLFASFGFAGWTLNGRITGGVDVYSLSADITSITAVPEPETMASIAAAGLIGLAIFRSTRSAP